MERISFYIGLNDKDSKQQEISIIDAFKIVENVFNTFSENGATIRECRGIYKHEDGTRVIENTLEAFCYNLTDETIVAIVNVLKNTLNQESIMVVKTAENVAFM